MQRLREEKQQKSFNIKVPVPLSPGVSPGSFMSNEFAMMLFPLFADSSARGFLPLSRTRLRDRFKDEEKKNNNNDDNNNDNRNGAAGKVQR